MAPRRLWVVYQIGAPFIIVQRLVPLQEFFVRAIADAAIQTWHALTPSHKLSLRFPGFRRFHYCDFLAARSYRL